LIHVGKSGDNYSLIGEAPAVRKGQLLMDVHVKHQKELLTIQDRKQRKLNELNEYKERYANLVHIEFSIEADLIGLVIGKKGENIQRVMKKHHVEVEVDGRQSASDSRTVRVSGETPEAVEAAREELEFVNHLYEVQDHLVGWLLGRKMQHIQDIQQKSGVYRARFDQDKRVLVLCGTRQAIDDAIVLLDSHMQYYDVFKEQNRQEFAISRDLFSLQPRRRLPPTPEAPTKPAAPAVRAQAPKVEAPVVAERDKQKSRRGKKTQENEARNS
jgi:KH domain